MDLDALVLTPELLARIGKSLERRRLEIASCEELGHPHAREYGRCYFRGRLEISMRCPDCGDLYEGRPTSRDYAALQNILNTGLD